MSTNKVVLRTQEEFMTGYDNTYQPLFPLFIGSNSQAYPLEVGQLTFKRVEAIGDIRSKRLLPKDTEIKQVSVRESSKAFKKYVHAIQYTQSSFQDQQGIEDAFKAVLDEHVKQFDERFLLGDGTAANNVLNNSLYWSADGNYILNGSATVAAGSDSDNLQDFHAKLVSSADTSDAIAGRKLKIIYGSTARAKFNSLYKTSNRPFKTALAEVLGANWNVIALPAAITPAGVNGWIDVNLDKVKLHYCGLPSLLDQDIDRKALTAWANFVQGSNMLEVLASGAINRTPCTFA